LYPFYEVPVSAKGWEQPVPLGGVKVCAVKRRPYKGKWNEFQDLHDLCATTGDAPDAARGDVVLRGLPAMSELIVTARKAGFESVAYAVTTSEWDEDITAHILAKDPEFFALMRDGSSESMLAPGVTQSPTLGSLVTYAVVNVAGRLPSFLGAVRVSLEPQPKPDGGPFYSLGGKWVPDSTATVPGALLSFPDTPDTPTALFANLEEDEYVVRFDQPNAFCSVLGDNGEPVYGFAGQGGTVRAPVLAGYRTAIAVGCTCLHASTDPKVCAPSSDAGVR
jgi:hypothetical protein